MISVGKEAEVASLRRLGIVHSCPLTLPFGQSPDTVKTVPFIVEHYSQTKAALVSRQGGFFLR